MKLLFYNEEQNSLRVYDTEYECWEDLIYMFVNCKNRFTSLTRLISWGWELVGEI